MKDTKSKFSKDNLQSTSCSKSSLSSSSDCHCGSKQTDIKTKEKDEKKGEKK